MKYENIQHGDWFEKKGQPVQIEDAGPVFSTGTRDEIVANVDLKPKALTQEVLFANGFISSVRQEGQIFRTEYDENYDVLWSVAVTFKNRKAIVQVENHGANRNASGVVRHVNDLQVMLRACCLYQVANKFKLPGHE